MAETIRVILNGAAGRMGRAVTRLLARHPGMTLAGAIEHPGHDDLGKDAGEVAGIDPLGVRIGRDPGEGDVLVDFSHPAATAARAEESAASGIALVIGTTGLGDEHLDAIRRAAEKVPCVLAANMSVGVALATRLVREMARTLPEEFDIEIVESHHRHKKDAPSGTALRLARAAAEARGAGEDLVLHGRSGRSEGRRPGEIGIHALRMGEEPGDHVVIFDSPSERLAIRHRAHSRDAFAAGALRAVLFVHARSPGLYDISDVLAGP